jgi:hypothetical protein
MDVSFIYLHFIIFKTKFLKCFEGNTFSLRVFRTFILNKYIYSLIILQTYDEAAFVLQQSNVFK